MKKKRGQPKSPARATIADIKREMWEPRLAKSRDDPRYQAVLAAEKSSRSK
jgi:hypothetical protein